MVQHKFKIGQVVDLVLSRRDANIPGGRYTVQRLMPGEGLDLQYRVKNLRDGHERVVYESQLIDGMPIGAREFAAFRRVPYSNNPGFVTAVICRLYDRDN